MCTENKILYRCGWCGLPVQKDGDPLPGLRTLKQVADYLATHAGEKEINVDGFCCEELREGVK